MPNVLIIIGLISLCVALWFGIPAVMHNCRLRKMGERPLGMFSHLSDAQRERDRP